VRLRNSWHGRPGDSQDDWVSFAEELAEYGYQALTLHNRGYHFQATDVSKIACPILIPPLPLSTRSKIVVEGLIASPSNLNC
jgi:hypothetical protein